MNTINELENLLIVGTRIKIGEHYAKKHYSVPGEIIVLVEGHFEYDNGLYCEDQTCPSVWDEQRKDWDSIYHLFGNNFEDFMDCEIIKTQHQ